MEKIRSFWEDLPEVDIKKVGIISAIAIAGTLVTYAASKNLSCSYAKKQKIKNMHKICGIKKGMRDKLIEECVANTQALDPSIAENICSVSIQKLSELLSAKEVTYEQVVIAHIMNAASVAQPLNLLADICFNEALDTAKRYDQGAIFLLGSSLSSQRMFHSSSNPLPLQGIVFSVNDSIEHEGYDSTCGLATRCLKPCSKSASIISILKDKCGAISLAHGNVSQCVSFNETTNYIWGRAMNPIMRDLTTGGSCGGDAGLVGTRSVSFALTVDYDGSARIPGAYCSVCTIKHTTGRLPTNDAALFMSNKYEVSPAYGFMARSVDDLTHVVRSVFSAIHTDVELGDRESLLYLCPPLPFDEEAFQSFSNQNKRTKIGVLESCKFFPVCNSVKRAIQQVQRALEEDRSISFIEVTEMESLFREGFLLFIELSSAEGNFRTINHMLSGEEIIQQQKLTKSLYELSNNKRKSLANNIRGALSQERTAQYLDSIEEKSGIEYCDLLKRIVAFSKKFLDLWNSYEIEALICPVTATPALAHDYSKEVPFIQLYTALFNVLDYPAGVVAVTKVNADEQYYIDDRSNKNVLSRDRMSVFIDKSLKNSFGLPIAVQVVTLPNQDEKCLGLMKRIESSL